MAPVQQRGHNLEQFRALERATEHDERRQPAHVDGAREPRVVGEEHGGDRREMPDHDAHLVGRHDNAWCAPHRGLEGLGDRRGGNDEEVGSLPQRVGYVRTLVVVRRHHQRHGRVGRGMLV